MLTRSSAGADLKILAAYGSIRSVMISVAILYLRQHASVQQSIARESTMYLLVVQSYHDHNPHQPPEHQRNLAIALVLLIFGYWFFA